MSVQLSSTFQNYSETTITSGGVPIVLSEYFSGEQRPSIVFLPGTMTHPLFYDAFLGALSQNGFNVVGVHFLSHGKSPRIKTQFTIDDMLQNCFDTIDYVSQKYNNNFAVLGSSQGGILNVALAAKDARIKAIFAHNVMLPSLPTTISVMRFPSFLIHIYPVLPPVLKLASWLFPKVQLPISFYLETDKIFSNIQEKEQFFSDPIGLVSYPLCFLASLFSIDMTGATNGDIKCPVVIVCSKGDPLFPYEYTMEVYDRLVAPSKEQLLFDEPHHLIFNNCLDTIISSVVERLNYYLL